MKKIIALSLLAGSTALSFSAIADSPQISASHGQCAAKWHSSSGAFEIWDKDHKDHDTCYVKYGFTKDELHSQRNHPDVPNSRTYPVEEAGCEQTIWWKVCKQRQDDDDICSSVRSDSVH